MAATFVDVRRDPATMEPAVCRRWRPDPIVLASAAVITAGALLRFWATGPLWLDESLSVQIARRPLDALFAALRHDGSPPLYYLLLHGWIAVFGDSTVAVRALSSLVAIACLPLAWYAGAAVGGRRLAGSMLLVTAAAPWALRFATEARMYALLFGLVLAGIPLLVRALQRPSLPRLVLITLDTAAIIYTHYWGLYLLGPVALWLLGRRAWRVLAAMAAAGLLFLPWLPSLVFQLRHTGTPWAGTPTPSIVSDTVLGWGGPSDLGPLLGLSLLAVALLGLVAVGRPAASGLIAVDLRGGPATRPLAAFALAPLLVALALGTFTHAGWTLRYTAVCLPFFLLLVARGVAVVPGRRARAGVLAMLVGPGLLAGVQVAMTPRTQAGAIAAFLRAHATPGDVVGYCPDQLAPAVHRLLPTSLALTEIAYGDPSGPALVDWADYSERVHLTTPAQFSGQLLAAGTGRTVWLVMQDGYRVFEGTCPAVETLLSHNRGTGQQGIRADRAVLEHALLEAFLPPTAG